MAQSSIGALSLYHKLMREGNKFKNFNYKEYSKRRIRSEFKENASIKDPRKITQLISKGNLELESLRRQTFLNNMYFDRPLVVEVPEEQKN